jgi:Zn-dependent protease with chaperone function
MTIGTGFPLAAHWFDGRTAAGLPARVAVSDDVVHVLIGDRQVDVPKGEVVVSAPVAGVPLRLELPEGGVLVLDDVTVDPRSFGATTPQGVVHALERNPAAVVVALLAVFAVAVLAYVRGIPWLADRVAQRIPIAAEAKLGDAALASLDRVMFGPSKLAVEERADLEARFDRLVAQAGLPSPPKLLFRSAEGIGANALTLPGGTIVVTDQLVARVDSPDETAAVFAHELGHVAHRDTMRALLAQSSGGLVLGALLGDVSGIGSLAAAAPAMLIGLSYSRASEEQADDYALALLPRAGLSPALVAESLEALGAAQCSASETKADAEGCGKSPRGRLQPPAYLSTHPDLEERIARARAAVP